MPRNTQRKVLESLLRDYADIGARSRMGLRIALGERKTTYTVAAIGVIREKRQLVLRAPVNDEGSLIPVLKGQILHCDWVNSSTAFHFRSMIVRILFEPVPLVYIELPLVVERHTLRGVPRALSHVRAFIQTPAETDAIIVDISTGGVRIAVQKDMRLEKGQDILLLANLQMLTRDFHLSLHCQVTGPVPTPDPKHPDVAFYGVTFDHLSDNELLILHAYVQQCLAMETDTLTQVLLLSSKEVETAE